MQPLLELRRQLLQIERGRSSTAFEEHKRGEERALSVGASQEGRRRQLLQGTRILDASRTYFMISSVQKQI